MTEIPHRNPAKAYLQRYRAALARQRSLTRSIAELRASLTGTTQALRPDPVAGSGPTDRMADTVAKIADMEAAMADELDRVQRTLHDVLEAIAAVPDETQRAVLTLRYVEGLGWTEIQERLHYERTQTYVVHGRALVEVNRWLGGKEEVGSRK